MWENLRVLPTQTGEMSMSDLQLPDPTDPHWKAQGWAEPKPLTQLESTHLMSIWNRLHELRDRWAKQQTEVQNHPTATVVIVAHDEYQEEIAFTRGGTTQTVPRSAMPLPRRVFLHGAQERIVWAKRWLVEIEKEMGKRGILVPKWEGARVLWDDFHTDNSPMLSQPPENTDDSPALSVGGAKKWQGPSSIRLEETPFDSALETLRNLLGEHKE